jgi:hypothetical protein
MMKFPWRKRSKRWWVVSIAIHVVLIAVLMQIAFRYPLGELIGVREREIKPERLQFIRVAAPESGTGRTERGSKTSAPAPLAAPTEVPTTVPAPTAADTSRAQAAGGRGDGLGAGGAGRATGIVPLQPDPRIALTPGPISRTPRTVAEDVDSIVSVAIGIYNDSAAIADTQRKPGDWTVKGKDGQVWGWDPNGNIRLGKFTIPGALLAMLPLNTQNPMSPIEMRRLAWIRRDVLENTQRSISEDEFRAAVKRIRERKEKERRQKEVAVETNPIP